MEPKPHQKIIFYDGLWDNPNRCNLSSDDEESQIQTSDDLSSDEGEV